MKTNKKNSKYYMPLSEKANNYFGGGFNIEPGSGGSSELSGGVEDTLDTDTSVDTQSKGAQVGGIATAALQTANGLTHNQGLDHNAKSTSWQNYNFGADMTEKKAKKWDSALGVVGANLDGITAAGAMVPGWGWIMSGVAQALKFGSKFLPKLFGDSSEDITKEYMGKKMGSVHDGKAAKYNQVMSEEKKLAVGGYTDLLSGGDPEVIEGEKHEQGGTYIGMGANGKPNIAEEGEVKWGNFIFSDRF